MQKKVLFVNLRLNGGGSEKVMAMLASYYADHGMDTQMILLSDCERVYPVSKNVQIIECYCPMVGNKILWHLKRLKSLRQAIKRSGADTIISFMWDVNLKVLLAAVGLNKKVIISERADPDKVKRQSHLKFAQKWIFPMADASVFQTEQVMHAYPLKIQKKSVVIPNPVIIPEMNQNIQKEKTIIAAGRLYDQKNFTMLITAFSEFHQLHPEYILKIFGKGEEREKLEKLAADLNLQNAVFLPGFVSDLHSDMQKASIYASSSNFEGISNAMLEAMATGLPVVCTDCPVGGAAMAIENGKNGFLVPVNDTKAMAAAFSQIADDAELSKRISKEARKSSERFSIDAVAEKWMNL